MPNIVKYRVQILSLIIITVVTLITINKYQIGDFWEHNAVVKELATNPFSPHHPQLLLNAPHAFYSPYSLTVGLLARLLNNDSILALSIAGIINLIMLLFALNLFLKELFKNEAVVFYSFLFIPLYWGLTSWYFSGFFNLESLSYNVSYPSTFSAWLLFITLTYLIRFSKSHNKLYLIPIVIFITLVQISHPLTYIVLITGIIAFSIGLNDFKRIELLFVFLTIIIAFGLSVLWPYYPYLKLILSDSNLFNARNGIMYDSVISKIYPLFICIPLLFLRLKQNRRDSISIFFIGLALIYLFGGITGKYALGRVISYAVLILQIILANYVAEIENGLKFAKFKSHTLKFSFSIFIILVLFPFSYNAMINTASHALHKLKNNYEQYAFLSRYTKQYDLILADLNTSWMVPSFGGKVIASEKPLPFVKDEKSRQNDINSFFNSKTPLPAKIAIVQKYDVNYLLLNKKEDNWESLENSFRKYGSINFQNNNFILMRFNNNISENINN